jgi:polyhydroxyalkanoate synthase
MTATEKTTKEFDSTMPPSPHSPEKFSANMAKIADYYQRIMQLVILKKTNDNNKALDPFNISNAFAAMFTQLLSKPEKLMEYQMDFTHNYMKLLDNITHRFMGNDTPPLYKPVGKDNRFKDAAWEENAMFDFIKQSYLMTSDWMQHFVKNIEGLDSKTSQKIIFHTRQFLDALSPSNFVMTNPQVLKATLESNGENLVKGMENLLSDIESSKQMITITTSDSTAFEIGDNIAVTPGKIIYQNDLMQLIHYTPLRAENYSRPLLVMPPWINKYYILDLKKENSYVRWLLEQGYSVFMISWVNPDKSHAGKGFEDYMSEGPLAALDAIEAATGSTEVNVVGYCLGGTLLSATLSYMKSKNDRRIKSATLLTTLIDFSQAGELSLFVDDEQLRMVEERMEQDGFFDGCDMATTFNMLKANDMIWSFFINNYLLGKSPFPFDLLYWNADSTRLPAAMHSFYLRNMYRDNLLKEPCGITLKGTSIDVSKVDIPCYLLSTREDHIAPWKSTYLSTTLLGGDLTFVLAASGHIAGVVNHPGNNKYSYWTNNTIPASAEEWLTAAEEHKGSWWENWHQWQQHYAGKMIAVVEDRLPALEDAPGSYVKVRC